MGERRACPACAEAFDVALEACPACGAFPEPTDDDEHLRLLSIFHYVLGGVTAFFACFPLIHLGLGLLMLFSPQAFGSGKGGPPPTAVGLLFAVFGGAAVLLGWTLAILMFVAGRALSRRRHPTLCMVTAAAECLMIPLGTVLGTLRIGTTDQALAAGLRAAAPDLVSVTRASAVEVHAHPDGEPVAGVDGVFLSIAQEEIYL